MTTLALKVRLAALLPELEVEARARGLDLEHWPPERSPPEVEPVDTGVVLDRLMARLVR